MKFFKYHGTGNDFVMIDQRHRKHLARTDTEAVTRLCHRHFGVGADGVILLQNLPGYDFEMIYFNNDGSQSFCGNGSRCAVAFAHHLGVFSKKNTCKFRAIDGDHEAVFYPQPNDNEVLVEIKMADVGSIERKGKEYVLNTGSPHFVRFVPGQRFGNHDVVEEGRAVRYSERFRDEGINFNLACTHGAGITVMTYERGVEAETLSCGTGVTASAIASFFENKKPPGRHEVPVQTRGGRLSVKFTAHDDGTFSDIWLCGPARRVFEGKTVGLPILSEL